MCGGTTDGSQRSIFGALRDRSFQGITWIFRTVHCCIQESQWFPEYTYCMRTSLTHMLELACRYQLQHLYWGFDTAASNVNLSLSASLCKVIIMLDPYNQLFIYNTIDLYINRLGHFCLFVSYIWQQLVCFLTG